MRIKNKYNEHSNLVGEAANGKLSSSNFKLVFAPAAILVYNLNQLCGMEGYFSSIADLAGRERHFHKISSILNEQILMNFQDLNRWMM